MIRDLRARLLQQLDDLLRRRLAHVVDVGLIRDAEHEEPRAFERLLRTVVQRLRDQRAAEVRHVRVHLPCQLDELRVEVVLPRLPRQVEGIDRDAVPAEAWARLEAHEAERLRLRRLDDLPDVEIHPFAELRELVHERDVDRAEDVLEQLGQLRRLRGRDRDDGLDGAAVQLGRALGAGGRQPAHELRRVPGRPVSAAGVDPFGRERQVEVLAGLEAARLENRLEALPRRAGVGRRLEHDQLAPAEPWSDELGSTANDREVGLTLAGQRGRQRDQDRVGLLDRVEVRGRRDAAVVDELLQLA